MKTSVKEEVGAMHFWWEHSPQINCVDHSWLMDPSAINSYIQLSATTAWWVPKHGEPWSFVIMRSSLGLLLGMTPHGDCFNLFQTVAPLLVELLPDFKRKEIIFIAAIVKNYA